MNAQAFQGKEHVRGLGLWNQRSEGAGAGALAEGDVSTSGHANSLGVCNVGLPCS